MLYHLKSLLRRLRKQLHDKFLARSLQSKGIALGNNLTLESGTRLERLQGGKFHIGANVKIGQGTRIQVFDEGELTIGDNVTLRDHCCIECRGKITIGESSYLNNGSIIYCNGEISLGSEVLLAPYVFLTDHDHAIDDIHQSIVRQGFTQPRPVSIGNGAWLGVKATITKGVTVGEGAVIGANAVVTKDIPAYAVAVGIPAKVIRTRHTEWIYEEPATIIKQETRKNPLRLTIL